MILTAAQVKEITGRERFKAQCRQLDHLGIPYKKRINGSPMVTEFDLHQKEGQEEIEIAQRKGPRLDLANA